ncbi:MAG TPA: hypothetical protein VHE34_24820 [Puia sp.]|jgi:hypothetical protein|uniref:hypothetical protein n=1 Tax=Puia sp. TaxID=2045100 RepID=UPI002D16D174|nr:hypothetical protein [Puia sp.]HVU98480.1 hypothetical protein [Puia sp.]
MKILYIIIFFLGMLVITGLAYQLFEGLEDGFPLWLKLVLGSCLALAIVLLVLFIRGYIRKGTADK